MFYVCLFRKKNKQNSSCISPDLLPDTSLKRWMYWWTMEKSVWKEKFPQLDVREWTLNGCHQVVCVCVCVCGCIHTAHVQQKLFVMICMSCHQVFSLYLQICWGLSEPGINITLRYLRVKMREKEGVKWNWVKDLNKQWVEERLGVKTQPGIMWKKESSWRPE